MAKVETWDYDAISFSHIRYLRWVGFFPFKGHTLDFIGTRFIVMCCHFVTFVYNTMHIGYGIHMFARKDFEVDFICDFMVVQSLCIRYMVIYLKRPKFLKMMALCRDLWDHLRTKESVIVRKFERKVYYCTSFILCNTLCAATLYTVSAHFTRLPPLTVNGTERRMLPFRFYVDVQEEPAYTITVIFQATVVFSIAVIIPGVETVGLYLIMMASGYLRSIQYRLISMTSSKTKYVPIDSGDSSSPEDESQLPFMDILECAIFHHKIMYYCQELELFMRGVYMTIITCNLYNLSLIGIKLLDNDEHMMKYAALLVLTLGQFFICQWGPEHLLNESTAIGNAAYFATMQHPIYDQRANRLLFFMMIRAQKPIHLTAGGYIYLSMESFGNMITNAFSFFTVARNFRN